MKKIKGHFLSPVHPSVRPSVRPSTSIRTIKVFGGKKKLRNPIRFWNLSFRYLSRNNCKEKSMDPIGRVLRHFPSGDKGFQGSKKGRSSFVFLKVPFSFIIQILNWKVVKWTPSASLRSSFEGLNIIKSIRRESDGTQNIAIRDKWP